MITKLDKNGFVIGNYPCSNEEDVLSPVLYEGNFILPKWNGIGYEEGINNSLVNSSQLLTAKEKEFEFYIKRKNDGVNAYLALSAEFRLAKLSGQISEETHSYLEELLTPVRNEVMFGQWKKGLEILESIGVLQIGVDLYNRLHSQISEYILNNY